MVYIAGSGSFLPGQPVQNNQVTDHLGVIDPLSLKIQRLILRQNSIKTRYYVPRESGRYLYTNAQMAALSVSNALSDSAIMGTDLSLLSTATTQGDLLVPGHGSAVHSELSKQVKLGQLEVASFQSVCASSVMALKAAWAQVKLGEARQAAVVGSEFSSRWFQPGFYQPAHDSLNDREVRMAAEFLRYTLSDGAGAVICSEVPNPHGPSFKVDWIKLISLADKFDTCMYAGIAAKDRYDLRECWSHYPGGPMEAAQNGAIMLMQDMVLLKRIIRSWVGEYLRLIDEGYIQTDNIDHLLFHYSAHSLRQEVIRLLKLAGGMIDEEKWFTNLYSKGNTGSAAFFIMLDEFAKKNIAKAGEKILCIVPESGRSMIGFIMLTKV